MRKDELRIKDILTAIDKIEAFAGDIEFEKLKDDDLRKSAIMAQLTIIGEASKNISEELKRKYPLIEWNKASSLRNVLVHAYFGVEWKIIWDTIKNDLPNFRNQLKTT